MIEVVMRHGAQSAVAIWFQIQRQVEQERAFRGMHDSAPRADGSMLVGSLPNQVCLAQDA